MKSLKTIKEEMSVGAGVIAGMPTASPAEQTPVVLTPMQRRKKFAGKDVFVVSSDAFQEFARSNKDAPIILEDELTGAMVYLRYGKR
jgi:hypothetical protein